jgi:hypothetical protein
LVLQPIMKLLKNPNPLNIIGNRRVEFLPTFFETTHLQQRYNLIDSVAKWIDCNLKGRYYVDQNYVVSENRQMEIKITVGFENKKELSYFMLACPHLKYK